jgi:hypothetical protein
MAPDPFPAIAALQLARVSTSASLPGPSSEASSDFVSIPTIYRLRLDLPTPFHIIPKHDSKTERGRR